MVVEWGAILAGVVEAVSLRRWYLRRHLKEVREGCLLYPGEEHSKQEEQLQRP